MKCPICRHSAIEQGTVSVTLERGHVTIVFKNVPARVCPNCGEQFLDEGVTASLLKQAEAAVKAGVEIEVRSYAA